MELSRQAEKRGKSELAEVIEPLAGLAEIMSFCVRSWREVQKYPQPLRKCVASSHRDDELEVCLQGSCSQHLAFVSIFPSPL